MKNRTLLGLFVSLLLIGCAGTTVPRISPDHPASPSAQEVPLPPQSSTLGGEHVRTDKESVPSASWTLYLSSGRGEGAIWNGSPGESRRQQAREHTSPTIPGTCTKPFE